MSIVTKKLLSLTLMCLLLLFFSSCVPETHPPIGVWRSEVPNITLYITPDYQIPIGGRRYPGRYTVDDEEMKIFATFGNGPRFQIFDMSGMGERGGTIGEGRLFAGSFRVRNDELHFIFTPAAQEQTGRDNIVFHRLEHYDPINPEDWLPSN